MRKVVELRNRGGRLGVTERVRGGEGGGHEALIREDR